MLFPAPYVVYSRPWFPTPEQELEYQKYMYFINEEMRKVKKKLTIELEPKKVIFDIDIYDNPKPS